MILAGDIGGTNTRLALFEGPEPLNIQVFHSGSYPTLAAIAREYLAAHGQHVKAACFGIAGPVRNGAVEATNLPWKIDGAQLAADLGLAEVRLLNDLEANAHGIAALPDSDFAVLRDTPADRRGNRALISAGTGLGEAGLISVDGFYLPLASEGGHADFAPRNATEIALFEYLARRFGHVSYERILSGPGLVNVYNFFRDAGAAQEPSWLAQEIAAGDPAAAIARNADRNELCRMALNLFVSVYGAEAGNIALRTLATGGVYIGGGIAPKILPKLREPEFLRAFDDKGRVARLLESIPVRVILNDKAALIGAGRVALGIKQN
ncbi:MAG TPA: glucokinase [Bryobacteraceae bacterium]|jgi:glucokinase|nr:glucokinase [Bryobacteraceae bacterium]